MIEEKTSPYFLQGYNMEFKDCTMDLNPKLLVLVINPLLLIYHLYENRNLNIMPNPSHSTRKFSANIYR